MHLSWVFPGSCGLAPKLSAALFVLLFNSFAAFGQLGTVEPSVPCLEDQNQTYSLFRPKYYSSKKRFPILIVLDPKGQSQSAVEAFREGAETFGFIVASPQGLTGPLDPNISAHPAMQVYEDLVRRFAVDIDAVYMGGLGSSASIAFDLTRRLKTNAGLILCSPQKADLSQGGSLNLPLMLTAGHLDAAYSLVVDEKNLPPNKTLLAVTYAGVQQWPPQELTTAGLGWLLEKAAQERGEPLQPERLESIYRARAGLAEKLTLADQYVTAYRLWESLNPDVFPAHTQHIQKARTDLKASQKLKKQWQALREALDMEATTRQLFEKEFKASMGLSDPGFRDHLEWWRRQVGTLMTLATQGEEGEKQAAASRLLEFVWGQSYLDGLTQLETRSYKPAIYHFRVACEAFPDQAFAFYALSCAYAGDQQKELALEALESSVAMGVNSSELFHQQPLFDSFRNDQRFQALLKKLNTP